MNKKFRKSGAAAALAVLMVLCVPQLGRAQADAPAVLDSTEQQVQSFDSRIVVNKDASIDVAETIVYEVGEDPGHGIYRYIPLRQVAGAAAPAFISGLTVTDENGKAYPIASLTYSSSETDVKVGDPNVTITGEHTYVVRYHVTRAIGYFSNYDEIYWNATGNGWVIPIDHATATVVLPGTFTANDLHLASYCGAEGDTANCGNYTLGTEGSSTTVTFSPDTFLAGSYFAPGEGMTVAVGFPKGVVAAPVVHWWEKSGIYYVFSLCVFGLFLILFLSWLFSAYIPRHSKLERPVIAEYEPPKGVTPSMAAYIWSENTSMERMVTADILYLATEGHITIEETTGTGIFHRESFALSRTGTDVTEPKHLVSLYGLVTNGATATNLDDLKGQSLYTEFDAYFSDVKVAAVSAEDGGADNPDRDKAKMVLLRVILLGAGTIFGTLICLPFFDLFATKGIYIPLAAILVVASIFASAFIFSLVGLILRYRLARMTPTWYAVAGLREYIKVAEADRIKFESNPADSARIFSMLLPYATAFGLEDKWVKVFDGIITTAPSWYHSRSGGMFHAAILSSSIGSLSGSMRATANSGRPSSSGGSGGGGFSGGGGGGGGGGGW